MTIHDYARPLIVAAILLSVLVLTFVAAPRFIPPCQEDAVIVGRGDFNSSGYWSRYECVTVDELAAAEGRIQP